MSGFELRAAAIAAFIYWASLPYKPYPGNVLVKIAAMVFLLVYVWRNRAVAGLTLSVAVLAHAAGDVLIDRPGLFVAAMAAFFVGHVLYAVCFWPWRRPRAEWGAAQYVALALLVTFASSLYLYLTGYLTGVLAAAVPVYICGIVSMAALALLGQWTTPWLPLGAVSYMVSDSMIALDAFVQPLGVLRYAIWPTYAAAQILIVGAYMAHRQQHLNIAT